MGERKQPTPPPANASRPSPPPAPPPHKAAPQLAGAEPVARQELMDAIVDVMVATEAVCFAPLGNEHESRLKRHAAWDALDHLVDRLYPAPPAEQGAEALRELRRIDRTLDSTIPGEGTTGSTRSDGSPRPRMIFAKGISTLGRVNLLLQAYGEARRRLAALPPRGAQEEPKK